MDKSGNASVVYIAHGVDEISTRKAKAALPDGVKLLRERSNSFYLSSTLSWDALREWGSKNNMIIGIANGGEA